MADGVSVTIMGAKEAQAYLSKLHGGAKYMNGAVVQTGSNVVYAYGIEFGQKRKGGLARRAGGSFALTDAYKAVKPDIAREVRDALPGGPSAVLAALKALANDVLTGTKEKLKERVYGLPIPVGSRSGKAKWRRTGTLRRSYHVEVG